MTNNKTFLGWIINGTFTPEQANALQKDADAVEEVMYERLRQFNKWGDQSGRRPHEFLAIMVEEVGEVAKDINDLTYEADKMTDAEYCAKLTNLRTEFMQVAAVCVQAMVATDKLLERCK